MMPSLKTILAGALFAQGALVLAASPVIYSCTKPNTAAITFDDGPYWYMKDIVDTLSAAGAKGTFFLNGNNWGCIYDETLASYVKYAYSKGHQIASHTWSHADMSTISKEQLHNELQKVDTALKKIVGVKPRFVRPPYGSFSNNARQVADERGVRLVNWDVDSRDAAGADANESKRIYDDFISRYPQSINALNHETHESSAYDVLPHLINLLRDNGYEMVTIAECLGQSPYLSVGAPSPRDGSWHC